MNTTALLIMLSTQVIVTILTVYFFWRMLKSRPNEKSNQDDEKR